MNSNNEKLFLHTYTRIYIQMDKRKQECSWNLKQKQKKIPVFFCETTLCLVFIGKKTFRKQNQNQKTSTRTKNQY